MESEQTYRLSSLSSSKAKSLMSCTETSPQVCATDRQAEDTYRIHFAPSSP